MGHEEPNQSYNISAAAISNSGTISCGILDLYPREPHKHSQHILGSPVGGEKLEKSLISWDDAIAVYYRFHE